MEKEETSAQIQYGSLTQRLPKLRAKVVVIGNSIVVGLRHCPMVSRNFFSRYRTINLRIRRDQVENVLWRINGMVLPKSVRSVVILCGTNNIDTSSSDEISWGFVSITVSIFHRYPNIEVIVSGTFVGLREEQNFKRPILI